MPIGLDIEAMMDEVDAVLPALRPGVPSSTHEYPAVISHQKGPRASINRAMSGVLIRLSLVIAFAAPPLLYAQPTDPTTGGRYYGTTGERVVYDTAAQREARIRTQETAPLLERPIDPGSYLLGPGDILVLSIPTAEYRPYDLQVYPDGSVVIPRVGSVNVAGRTLKEGSDLILQGVGRVYRASGTSVSLRIMRQFKVSVLGDVRRPGLVVATPTTRVSEAIDLAGGTSTTANRRRIQLIRNGQVQWVDLLPFYAEGRLQANPFLEGGDVVHIGVQDPSNIIAIYGAVNRGGEFDFRRGDSVATLVRAAFGLTADAVRDSIVLASVSSNGDTISRSYLRIADDGAIVGDRLLEPGDRLFVPRDPFYFRTSSVVVTGEVVRPGVFPIIAGRTRLRDIVERFGGFTAGASQIDAVVIRRKEVLNRVDQKYQLILEIDPDKRTEEEVEYVRNKATERPGVMTVDFPRLLRGDERENIALEDLDSIYVPTAKNYVKVSGKVKNPGNITFQEGAGFGYYIALAGGYGWRADDAETKVIKARNSDTYQAASVEDYQIEPGDQIFVPEQKEGEFWAGFAQAVTIIAQLGTIVAVILSIRGQ